MNQITRIFVGGLKSARVEELPPKQNFNFASAVESIFSTT
jgi:hypothetical protein